MSPTLKVLLAEDNYQLRDRYRKELEQEGFCVTCVSDGQALFEIATKEGFDAILSDTDMPKLDGDEVFKQLRGSQITKFVSLEFRTTLKMKTIA